MQWLESVTVVGKGVDRVVDQLQCRGQEQEVVLAPDLVGRAFSRVAPASWWLCGNVVGELGGCGSSTQKFDRLSTIVLNLLGNLPMMKTRRAVSEE